jgi:hypothetical protein
VRRLAVTIAYCKRHVYRNSYCDADGNGDRNCNTDIYTDVDSNGHADPRR